LPVKGRELLCTTPDFVWNAGLNVDADHSQDRPSYQAGVIDHGVVTDAVAGRSIDMTSAKAVRFNQISRRPRASATSRRSAVPRRKSVPWSWRHTYARHHRHWLRL